MATKLDLLKEIYQIQNEIQALNEEELTDLTLIARRIEFESDKSTKLELAERLKRLIKQREALKIKIEHEKKVELYFATPTGTTHKAILEEEFENKVTEWKAYNSDVFQRTDSTIKTGLGNNWGVINLDKSGSGVILTIGIIDNEKSTHEYLKAYFGQDIEIRYESKDWRDRKESFRSSCCSCGDFALEGGNTIGERAMFYVGIGKLYESNILINFIKEELRSFGKHTEKLSNELENIRQQLANPLK